MKIIISTTALIVAAAVLTGCTSARPALIMASDGEPVAGVNIGAQDSNFLAQNWGKLTSGAIAGGALAVVARNNHWFGLGKKSDGGSSQINDNGSNNQTITVRPQGDNNTVYVYVGENQGNQSAPQ